MRRRLLAATTALALVVGPTAAFAEDGGDPPVGEDAETEVSPLAQLGEALTALAADLLVEGEAGEETLGQLETTLSQLVGAFVFHRMEVDALAEMEELESEEPAEAEEEDAEAEDGDGADGEAVSTVAHCAPRGSFGDLVEGMANHGEYMTAAAHRETVTLEVPTLEGSEGEYSLGEATTTAFDLSTVEGAEALCEALDVVYQARLLQLDVEWEDVDGSRAARVLAREQCKIQRLRARNGAEDVDAKEACAELRDRVKDAHEAERTERADARDAAKDERAAERAERAEAREQDRQARADAKAERAGGSAHGKGKSKGD